MDGSPDLPHLCVKSFIVHLPIAPHHGSLPQQFGLVWDLLLKADPEGPPLIFYAALQHGFQFTFYSFRASAAHIASS
jgi:hypothetical protein